MNKKSTKCRLLRTNECNDFFKLICSLSITIIISLFILISLYYCLFPDWNRREDKISDMLLVIIGITTIVLTYKEYYDHRQRVKAEVLGQYNKRYSENENINRVVEFLVCHISKLKASKPSVHSVEMFIRFFEEMDLQIEKERLDAVNVEELFSYYALYLDANPELVEYLGIDDYKSNNWDRFHRFVKIMAKTKLKGTKWKCENEKWPNIEFDECGNISINREISDYDYMQGHIITGSQRFAFLLAGMNDIYPNDEVLIREKRIYTKCNNLDAK